jgi:beta-glucosidase
VNPAGRLAETFPHHLEDVAATRWFPGGPNTVEHREGLYVGYRFLDTVGTDVLFPFGHGLSYTTFAFGEPVLDRTEVAPDELAAGGTVTVAVDVTNTGEVTGKAVVQVYVRDPECAVYRPDRELRAFAKVALAPGETTRVELALGQRAFAFWDVERPGWSVEPGRYEVLVGASSRDLRGDAAVTVVGEPFPARDEPTIYRHPTPELDVDDAAYAALLRRPLPPNPGYPPPYTRNTPFGAVADTPVGRLLVEQYERELRASFSDDPANAPLIRSMLTEAPLRTLLMGGRVTSEQLDLLVELLNGREIDPDRLQRVFGELVAGAGPSGAHLRADGGAGG